MAKTINLKQTFKEVTLPSPLMEGREKLEQVNVIGEYLTMEEVGLVTPNNKDPYIIMHVKEYPGNFIYGGSVVTDKVLRLASAVGSLDDLNEALKTQDFVFKLVTRKSNIKRENGGYSHYTDIEIKED